MEDSIQVEADSELSKVDLLLELVDRKRMPSVDLLRAYGDELNISTLAHLYYLD